MSRPRFLRLIRALRPNQTRENFENTEEVVENSVDLKEVLKQQEADDKVDVPEKKDTEEEKRYYSAKVVVKELERRNNSKLFLIGSLNGEKGEWYKMFGNSALFYTYDIGIRLGKKPRMRMDSDWRERFKGGFVSVRWIDKFIETMKEHGYSHYEYNEELEIYIFGLNKKYTTEEVKELRQQAGNEKDVFNQTVRPRNDYPEVWYNMLQLAAIIPPKVKRMRPEYREMLGYAIVDDLRQIFALYTNMANGVISRTEGKAAMLEAVNNMLAGITIISEVEQMEVKDVAKIGDTVAALKAAIKTKVKENKRGEIKKTEQQQA